MGASVHGWGKSQLPPHFMTAATELDKKVDDGQESVLEHFDTSKAEVRAPSLRDRILAATSTMQIDMLLLEGEAYQFASNSTRNRWIRAAKSTRQQLKAKTNEQSS